MALGLLATITPGVKADLNLAPSGLSTNLYLLLVGPTSVGKSYSRRLGQQLLDIVLPAASLPERMSGEQAIHALAARSQQSSLWPADELGVMLGQIVRKDSYMNAMEDLLLSLYDGGNYTYATLKGTTAVRNAHLNIVGGATPESMALAGAGAVLSGLLPRFAVVFPERFPTSFTVEQKPDQETERRDLLLHLRQIQALTQTPQGQRAVRFSKAALVALSALQGTLDGIGKNRLVVMAHKVAVLVALADLRTEVSAEDASCAIQVIGRWADGTQRLDPYLSRRAADLEFDRLLERVRALLRSHGNTCSRGTVSRGLRLDPAQAKRARDTLLEWGELKAVVNGSEEIWTLIG